MEHAVIVHLRLSNDGFGSESEREAIFLLSDRLEAAIQRAGAGEFDGNEMGGGACTLYMYGADADYLFSAVSPLLKLSPLARGGHVVKRYGEAGDPLAAQTMLQL